MTAAYARSQRLLEIGAISVFAGLCGWGLWRITMAAQWWALALLLLAAPLAWLATDLLSGLLHWGLDSFGSVRTPVIGQSFIRPFREHHVDPQAMTHHDFIETHGASCLAALPFLVIASQLPLDDWCALLAQSFLLLVGLGALATNQCHKWAHMNEAATPKVVRTLQRYRLILPRGLHALHHTSPFDSHFCMSNGWLNSPFNALLRLCR